MPRISVVVSPASYSVERRVPEKPSGRRRVACYLLAAGRSVLVVTVPDFDAACARMLRRWAVRAALLDDLCKVDLLVLDEVGIQRGSSGEKVILNQVIDRRLSSMRPVRIPDEPESRWVAGCTGRENYRSPQMDGGYVGELRLE